MEYRSALSKPDQEIIEIAVEDDAGDTESFQSTKEHPFQVKTRGWIGASRLKAGDEIFTSRGGWIKVSGATWLSKRQTVYNINVADYHTYFVGESGAWVHNMCAMKVPKGASKSGIFKEGANLTPRSTALEYRTIGRGGRTFVTTTTAITDIIGDLPVGNRMKIVGSQARQLENALGLVPNSIESRNIRSIVYDIPIVPLHLPSVAIVYLKVWVQVFQEVELN